MASKLSRSIATHTKLWYEVDARGQVVGRLAVQVVRLLQGKSKPIYHPSVNVGDHVVVFNTKDVVFTGRKWDQKLYRHHTGYPGGLKETVAKHLHSRDHTQVLRKAVSGMLPKNKLRKKWLRHLHLFPGEEHPYKSNITHRIPGPCPVAKKLSEYTPEEVTAFPEVVKVHNL